MCICHSHRHLKDYCQACSSAYLDFSGGIRGQNSHEIDSLLYDLVVTVGQAREQAQGSGRVFFVGSHHLRDHHGSTSELENAESHLSVYVKLNFAITICIRHFIALNKN